MNVIPSLTIFDLLQDKNNIPEIELEGSLAYSKVGTTYVNDDDFFNDSRSSYFRGSDTCSINLSDIDQNNYLKGVPLTSKNKFTKNDFEYGKLLGEGSYGKVIKAKLKSTGEWFAIKKLEKNFLEKKNMKYQIYIENEMLNAINHPGVIGIYGYFEDSGTYNFVEEYCSKGDLQEFINKNEKLSKEEIQFIMGQIILTLEYLAKLEIVHRDVKPENFMIDKNFRLKLADFATATYKGKIFDEDTNIFVDLDKFLGNSKINREELYLARSLSNHPGIRAMSNLYFGSPEGRTLEMNGAMGNGINEGFFEGITAKNKKIEMINRQNNVGTPEYMPPEIINAKDIGDYTDIWSAFCILFRLFAGETPFNDKNELTIYEKISRLQFNQNDLNKIPNDAKDLILSILKIDPTERYGYDKNKKIFNFDLIKKHPFFAIDKKYKIKEIALNLLRKCNFIKEEEFPFSKKEELMDIKEDKISRMISSMPSLNSRDVNGDKVLRRGTLKKQKRFYFYDKRNIVLFDTPRIDYFIPDTEEKRGTIPLTKECKAELVSNNQFFLKTPNRTYFFMCKDRYDISPWVKSINDAIEQYG